METHNQVQEAQRVPNKINPNRSTPRHVITKMVEIKEEILKVTRERQLVAYKGTPIRPSGIFSAEILQARSEWHNIFRDERKKPTTKSILPGKTTIHI